MSENCDAIAFLTIYSQFGAIQKPDSWRIAFTLLLWVKVLFWPKNADFLQQNADIKKIKRALVLKGIFSETACVCTYVTHLKFLA